MSDMNINENNNEDKYSEEMNSSDNLAGDSTMNTNDDNPVTDKAEDETTETSDAEENTENTAYNADSPEENNDDTDKSKENTDDTDKPDEKSKEAPKPKKRRIFTRRNCILIVLSLIFYLISSMIIINHRANKEVKLHYDEMQDLIIASIETFKTELYEKNICYAIDEDLCDFYVKLIAHFFNKQDATLEKITKMQDELVTDGSLYYINSDGTTIHSANEPELNISADTLNKLKAQGFVKDTTTSSLYNYCEVKGHNGAGVIIVWDSYTPNTTNLLKDNASGSGYVIRVIDKDGMIVNSSADEETGHKYSEFHTKENFQRYFKKLLDNTDEFGICLNSENLHSIYIEKEFTTYNGTDNTEENYTISIEYSLRELSFKMVPYFSKQLALILFVFILMIVTMIILSQHTNKFTPDPDQPIRSLILHVDPDTFTHLSALFLVCMILTMVLSMYIQLLIGNSRYYITTNRALNETVDKKTKYSEEYKNVETEFSNYYIESAELIAYLIQEDQDFLNNHTMKFIATQLNGYFAGDYSTNTIITVYDENGSSVASSNGLTGYQLSSDSEVMESKCRDFLYSNQDHLVLGMDDLTTDTCYISVKRTDATGIIVMETSDGTLAQLKDYYTVQSALSSTSYGKAYKAMVYLDDPTKLYVVEELEDSCIVYPVDYKFEDDDILTGTYVGDHQITKAATSLGTTLLPQGYYFFNETITDNVLYIAAIPQKTIIYDSLSGNLTQLCSCITLFLLILLCSRIKDDDDVDNTQKRLGLRGSISLRQNLMNELFQKNIHILIVGSVTIVLFIIAIEHFLFSSEIIDFLYGSKWPHHLNLFSVTKILVAMVIMNIISALMISFITLIAKNLGSRIATIGKMFCSLIQFGSVAFIIIYSCVQFGAKLSLLLTGAGFAGVIIGYAGQGLVNDLLTGLFIVFEGRFQVGDWITVGDWRGEVVEIGVRTTTITYGGDLRVLNNSCLNTLTVWSKTMSGALCYVSVDYQEDIDFVIDLIETSVGRYQKENPHIVEGPGVHGVTELGDNGVTLRIWALPDDEDNVCAIQRGILRTTKKLFEENNITIPFPQVVLHHGNDKDKTNNEDFFDQESESAQEDTSQENK